MHNEALDANEQSSPSRALADPRRAEGPVRSSWRPRPLAGFVTQLLACESALPSYRPRRRAAPGEATRLYHARGAAGDDPGLPSARAIDRSL